jgi:hypothetical protein
MEMEQIIACLLAEIKIEIRTNQAKTDANLKEMKEEMTSRPEAMIMNNQERMKPNHEKMDAY